MKNIFKNVFVIIGTIIGAGFASGKEVYIFFSKYGFNGLIGILIAIAIFFVVIWKVLEISKQYNIKNYNDFKINSQIKHIMNIFLLTIFYIMIAGFSAFINQEFNIPTIIGSVIIASMCFITFIKGISKGEKYIKVICISSVFISFIGFSYLVQMLYPVFGILGIIQIYSIIAKYKK